VLHVFVYYLVLHVSRLDPLWERSQGFCSGLVSFFLSRLVRQDTEKITAQLCAKLVIGDGQRDLVVLVNHVALANPDIIFCEDQ